MRIDILTLFPKMFDALNESIVGKAVEKQVLCINPINIRDFSCDKHLKCDDYPFGGGFGMVMTPQPIYDSINSVDPNRTALRVYLSPKGEVLNQKMVEELSQFKHIVLLCGHYEGVDQRVIDSQIDREISIGDYVLTGGEPAAIVLVDCISRYIEGVLGNPSSTHEESHSNFLLEYPQYTRPQDFFGDIVPSVLLSGHHENVRKWRLAQSIELTKKRRPDLYQKYIEYQNNIESKKQKPVEPKE